MLVREPVRATHCPVRVHDACFTSEVLLSDRCDCRDQLDAAMARLAESGGLLLHLPNEGRGIGLAAKVRAYDVQDRERVDTFDANRRLGLPEDARRYDHVPAILAVRVASVRLLTNNAVKRERLAQAST